MRALIIESSPPLRLALLAGLRADGWSVDAATDGVDGARLAATRSHDAIILGSIASGPGRLRILKDHRAAGSQIPTLLLTRRDAFDERIDGLEAGADDYLIVPFEMGDLAARLQVALHRCRHRATTLQVEDLRIDRTRREARRDSATIDLSPGEYAILELLALHAGRTVTRSAIRERLHGPAVTASSNVVDVYIGYLRRKLEHGGRPRLLHTQRGIGYRLGAPAKPR